MSTMKQWKSLTLQLRKVFDDLPSSIEREEIVSSINDLMKVLGDLSKSVASLPTAEEASRAKESLARLEDIINNNPLLRGYAPKRSSKTGFKKPNSGSSPKSPHVLQNIEPILERISTLSEGSLRAELENTENIPNSLLRGILTHLGRKVPTKNTRRDGVF